MNIAFRTKQFISGIADYIGMTDFALMRLKPKIIFGYHRVLSENKASENMARDAMWVSPSNFEKQIQWMKRIGEITSIEALVSAGKKPTKPTFAITFDDGWMDNYEYAFPILKKYNIPAMIFLSTNAIETNEMFWTEEIFYKTNRLIKQNQTRKIVKCLRSLTGSPKVRKDREIYRLLSLFVEQLKLLDIGLRKKMIQDYYKKIKIDSNTVSGQILSWNQIREMLRHNITFGSHTHTHMITKGADAARILDELIVSKTIIEQNTDAECKWFCYPNARFNNNDHVLLRKAGYDYGVTLHSSKLKSGGSSYYLPRFIMYEDITEVLGYIKLRLLRVPFF